MDRRANASAKALLLYDAQVSGNCYKVRPNGDFECAKVLQWMFFEQYSHEPNIAVVRYWVSIAAAPPCESQAQGGL